MGYRMSVTFDVEEEGYRCLIEPADVPREVFFEVLIGYLEDVQNEFYEARVLNPADVPTLRVLQRVSFTN